MLFFAFIYLCPSSAFWRGTVEWENTQSGGSQPRQYRWGYLAVSGDSFGVNIGRWWGGQYY